MKPHGDERWLDSATALTCNGRVPSLATKSTNEQIRDVASESRGNRALHILRRLLPMPPPHKFLRKGYFPKELPPSFKTASFAKVLDPKATHFPFVDAASSKRLEWTWMMHHSLARASHVRRSLGIPNPVTHWALAKEIADNWAALRDYTTRSTISKSIPTLRSTQGRAAVPRLPLADLMFVRVDTRARGRYLLKADVAEFYRSVYTHAISWALHTKETAKNSVRDKSLLGNRIDAAIQAAQYGQTNGIPVGPDTSLIIAEVMLAAVDVELQSRIGPLTGHRHHDDYELVFQTAREAERGKAVLQAVLLDFGLHLNPLKTELVELPVRAVSEWWTYVRHFDFTTTRDPRARIIEFFDEAFARKVLNPDEYVLAYAVGRVENEAWDDRSWQVIEPLLHQSLAAEPSAAHKVVRAIARAQVDGHSVNRDLLAQTIDTLLLHHAPYGHASEVAWMLWAALVFKIPLSADGTAAVARMNDAFVAVLALDLYKRGLAPTLDAANWAARMTTDELNGELWLLSYEARVREWLPSVGGGDHVRTHAAFAYLADRKVRFYTRMRSLTRRTIMILEETDAASYGDESDPWSFGRSDDEDDED